MPYHFIVKYLKIYFLYTVCYFLHIDCFSFYLLELWNKHFLFLTSFVSGDLTLISSHIVTSWSLNLFCVSELLHFGPGLVSKQAASVVCVMYTITFSEITKAWTPAAALTARRNPHFSKGRLSPSHWPPSSALSFSLLSLRFLLEKKKEEKAAPELNDGMSYPQIKQLCPGDFFIVILHSDQVNDY